MPEGGRRITKNCYHPDADLLSIMQKLLAFKIRKRDSKKEMLAAGGKNLTEEDKKHLEAKFKYEMEDTLRTEKTRVVNDIVFPSMANLVMFFFYAERVENIENETGETEEKKIFSKYIQELLLGENPKANGNVLYRLVNAMLSFDNLKYIIFQIIQEEIYEMLKLARKNYSKDDSFEYVILPDMIRAVTHARSLANEAISKNAVNFNRCNRPVLF